MQTLLQSEIQTILEMDSPYIVKFYQCVFDNKYINIVMELCRGITLSDYLQLKDFRIPEEQVQLIMYYVMTAIRYFHRIGIVHRDMKLDNVMIQGYESGNLHDIKVKLIDFGMSKLTERFISKDN